MIRLAGASFGAIKIDLPLPASGPGETDPEGISPAHPDFSALLAFAFLGGLILNVMPCVFPVIGLKIMGFARQAHGNRREICLHGAAYAGGVLLCFWTLGAVVAGLGLGWGAQLQSKWFLFLLCHLFLILSMNMAGAFRIGTPLADGRFAAGGGGIRRSFGAGLLATVISTPCSAPFLGAAIGYALAAPVIWSFAVFTLMGLGFASPYLFLSAFPGLLKILPKPGPWLETFRQAMSFPLFAATAYLAWTLEATLGEWRFLALLIGLVLTALACWLFGRSQIDRPASPRLARLLGAIALPVLVSGLALGLPPRGTGLEWGDWSPEAVRSLRSEGRPVYVDFTARWCATCQINKLVWLDSELASLVAEKRVALLRADWTLPDERIALTLRREFNRAAIPVNVLYPPGEGRGRVLPEILTAGAVIREMAGLP
ncbi:MAG: thioredoxin family protein [Planctomycetota bacterium]|nr:thioredoxin family protein [Planctomycetota bacterium]